MPSVTDDTHCVYFSKIKLFRIYSQNVAKFTQWGMDMSVTLPAIAPVRSGMGLECDGAVRKALVVDSSAAQLSKISAALREWGYHVRTARNGLDAMDMFDADPVTLVVSDWMTPRLTGPQLCQHIRQRTSEDYVYFILMTNRLEAGELADGLNSGADDYLAKPVNTDELLARVSAAERILSLQRSLMDRHNEAVAAHEKLQRIHAALEDDLKLAAKVQKAFTPKAFGTCKDIPISAIYEPCAHVSGDLIGYFELNADEIAVYSIDVSGHGVAAALMWVTLSQAFDPLDRQNNVAFDTGADGRTVIREPHQVAAQLNIRHQSDAETDQYFTMVYARINIFNGMVRICQAGHPGPAIVRKNGDVEFSNHGGPPIGLLPDVVFESSRFQLARGDRLFIYSDGVTDCLQPGDTTIDAALGAILAECARLPIGEFSNGLKERLARLTASRVFADDLSALYVEFRH